MEKAAQLTDEELVDLVGVKLGYHRTIKKLIKTDIKIRPLLEQIYDILKEYGI